ncbi:hypothetical protein JCM19236_3271 [Vibrio sp. JCM 19236]|nr:hypothetical protein JCM19236_3271 [Vibrio sp. JCM 19236]
MKIVVQNVYASLLTFCPSAILDCRRDNDIGYTGHKLYLAKRVFQWLQ